MDHVEPLGSILSSRWPQLSYQNPETIYTTYPVMAVPGSSQASMGFWASLEADVWEG